MKLFLQPEEQSLLRYSALAPSIVHDFKYLIAIVRLWKNTQHTAPHSTYIQGRKYPEKSFYRDTGNELIRIE